MKKILVTGAAGLIGSEVCRELLAKNFEVIACDNFSIGDWKGNDPKITWEKLDITSPEIDNVLSKHQPEAIIHCAAHPGGKSLAEPVIDVEVNALGSMRLFNWCARNNAHVIYLSSSAVYGPIHPDKPLKENDELSPGTIYAVCKVACENYLKILGEGYDLKWTVLRLFATYGNGHKANTFQGIVNVLLTQLLTHDKVVVKGSLARVRGLIYVKDAAKAIVAALVSEKTRGEIINVSHPKQETVGSILETLKVLLQRDIPVEVSEGTVGDPMFNYADCSKASQLLNFEPQYSLKQGLQELVTERLRN